MIAVLIALYILAILFFSSRRPKEWNAYQVNGRFDLKAPSDDLYAPFDELFAKENHAAAADLLLFSDYAEIDRYIDTLPSSVHIYGIGGTDYMASKSELARRLPAKYLPKTYIIGDHDVSDLPKGIYILKKNIQRQEGNWITNDTRAIAKRASEFVVCQELLQNVFLVNGRKINMRVYMLIVTDGRDMKFYIYKNGFMYYTKEKFVANSLDPAHNITTGYIDRLVYKENPLTHYDFYEWLGTERAALLQKNIRDMFQDVRKIYEPMLRKLNRKGFRFNIFGADVAPDSSLNVKLMEINKAPDLSYKDARDGAVKLKMVKDMMRLIDAPYSSGNPDNFLLL